MPSQSMRCFRRCCNGSTMNTTTRKMPTMPMGRFTKNTHRHERLSVRKPPMIGPRIVAPPNTIDM